MTQREIVNMIKIDLNMCIQMYSLPSGLEEPE